MPPARYRQGMAKTVQVGDLDDETYRGLSARAAELGLSVPELLRQVAECIARRPSMVEWLHRVEPRGAPVRSSDVIEALDCPLVTLDHRLASATGPRREIQVVG